MDILYHTDEVLALRPRLWIILILMGMIFTLSSFITFYVLGQVSSLECTRMTNQYPNCTLTKTLFGFTLNKKNIEGLINARVVEYRDSDDDTLYRVMLTTAKDQIPLTTYYSSGIQDKMQFTEDINTYLAKPTNQSFELDFGGQRLMILPITFISIGLLEIGIGLMSRATVWHIDKSERLVTHKRIGLFGARLTQYSLDDITGVSVSTSRDSDGDEKYRVDLTTKSGEVIPMTSWYSSGYTRKSENAALIREFLEEKP